MSELAVVCFAISAAIVAALVPGYSLWLLRSGRRESVPPRVVSGGRAARSEADDLAVAPIEVLVAVRDEAAGIAAKLENLARLESPPEGLRFWIVDGASTDGTAEIASARAARDARFRVVRTASGDKILQLNAVLPALSGRWVLVTDADAELAPDTVIELLRAAAADARLAVLGVSVRPAAAHPLELLHWDLLNRLRRAEARRGSAAIVAAPCYLFLRELLPGGFPAGVIADDVHVAMAGSFAGRRVGFVEREALELRSPRTLGALFRHKLRKSEAYLREVVRFVPRAPSLASPARAIFLWRAAQLFLFPLVSCAGATALAVWALSAQPASIVWALATLAAPIAIDATVAKLRGRPTILAGGVALGLLIAAVLFVAVISLPFHRRSAAYPKIAPALPTRSASA